MSSKLIKIKQKFKQLNLNSINFVSIIFFLFLLIYFLFGLSVFMVNDFTTWDSMGHTDLAVNINENLWPDFSGWNPNYYAGFQQGVLYPPLFHYVLAILIFVFPPMLATKVLLATIFVLFPLATYYFSKQIFEKKENARCMTLILTTSWFLLDNLVSRGLSWNGVGYDATMITGFLPAYLLTFLIFLFLGTFAKGLKEKKFLLPAIVLALCLLTHFLAYILLLFVILTIIFEKEKFTSLKVLFVSLLLSCFWWLPLFGNIKLIPLITFYFDSPPYLLFIVVIALIFSLFFNRKNNFVRIIGFFVTLITAAVLFWEIFGASFQFNKLHSIILLLVFIPIFTPILKQTNKKIRFLISIFFILLLIFSITGIGIENNFTQTVSKQEFSGRTLIILPEGKSLHEANASFVHQTNSEALIGLFSESAPSSNKIFGFARTVDSSQPHWGVRTAHLHNKTEEIIEKQISLLVLNQIVAAEWPKTLDKNLIRNEQALIKRTYESNRSKILFYDFDTTRYNRTLNVYFLEKQAMVELPEKVESIDFKDTDEWISFSDNWFNSEDETIYFWSDKNINLVSEINAKVVSFEKGEDGQKYFLEIDAKEEVPVLVKINWSANWRAYDENGEQIETFLATPSFILVFGKGKITLINEKTPLELFARIISVFALLGILFLFWKKNLKNRNTEYLMDRKKIKKKINKIKKIVPKKKNWIIFVFVLIFCSWLLFTVIEFEHRGTFSLDLFKLQTQHKNYDNEIEQVYLREGDIFCTYENSAKMFIKGREVLVVLKDGFFYFNRDELFVLKENAGEFSMGFFAVLKHLGDPIYCEHDKAEENGFNTELRKILVREMQDANIGL
jgi:hypothetical protein